MRTYRGCGGTAPLILIPALDSGAWPTSHPTPTEHEAVWAPEAVWTFWRTETSLAPVRSWTPDYPALSPPRKFASKILCVCVCRGRGTLRQLKFACLLSADLGSVAWLWSPIFERYCTLLTVSVLLQINPLNAELYPICHLLALLGVHHIFRVSELRVNQPPSHRAEWDNGKKY
jgi:hypothetical protein